MATTPTGKARKAGSKRVWIAVGLVALLVVGYLYFRSRGSSSASLAASPSGDSASSAVPATSSDGSGASTADQSSADLLGALSGENQELTKSFLDSVNGLVSLAGSSVGAPSASSSVGEPSGAGASSFASTTASPTLTESPFAPASVSSSRAAAPDISAATASPLAAAAAQVGQQPDPFTQAVTPTQTDAGAGAPIAGPAGGDLNYGGGVNPLVGQADLVYGGGTNPLVGTSSLTYGGGGDGVNPLVGTSTLSYGGSGTKYYTYKANVPLGKGDTLGFTPGKGYYVKA